MKIVSLQAENVKKLVAVEINPAGNVVEITGRNGQGKTSVLDSIWWALAGTSHIQVAPIRKGADKARIRLDLGEIIVTRTFGRKEDGSYTTSIAVENADGARFPSPQKMLDTLLGALSFDPLAFARAKPKEQFDQLRQFVPGVDFEALERQHRGDFERRTDINRLAKQERAAAQAIVVPDGTPETLIDESELLGELTQASDHNADIARRRANREQVRETMETARQVIQRTPAEIVEATKRARAIRDREVTRLEQQIEQLQQQIRTVETECDEEIARETEQLTTQAEAAERSISEIQEKLAAAGELPKEIDVQALQAKIQTARSTNAAVGKLLERRKHEKAAEQLEHQADELTAKMEARNADKRAAIAAAKMPVPGIEFGDGLVLLNGVPFEQASDAEQLRASVAIAMALNPKLRVIRIRDGSLLDETALSLVAEMADANDMQVWIERVDSSGKIGFVLEDGHVRKTEAEQEVAA